MVSACTIIARNYLAHARVLADSFRHHHPAGEFTVLLIDDEERQWDDGRSGLRVLRLHEIGLDPQEIRRLAAIYDVTELATAVKPPLLRHLLDRRRHVVYLDPDVCVYAPLDDLATLAERHGIVLTPHATAPFPVDERCVQEPDILSAGVYNLGFVGVGRGSGTFLDWWWTKTRRQALIDPARMLFTDQRWVDLVPCYFDAFIHKARGCNAAYWNLHERDLAWTGDEYVVDGERLTFFHFSGYDPRSPHLLSRHQRDRPRVLLSEHPALARICGDYAGRLARAGFEQVSAWPYGWERLASGVRVDRTMRRLYWKALRDWENGRGPEPPNPFAADGGESFLAWLSAPVIDVPGSSVSRYLRTLYESREDIRAEFPDLAGADAHRLLEWARTHGRDDAGIPPELRPPAIAHEPTQAVAAPRTDGVNLAGYLDAELGIGEAARLLSRAVAAAGSECSTLRYERTENRRAHAFPETAAAGLPFDVSIVCVNADQTPLFARDAGPAFREGRHTVGYWFWEIEEFPRPLHRAFDYVDEVWCASRFVTRAVAAAERVPVHTVPLPLCIPALAPGAARPAGEPFTFLFMFDFLSLLERKNPIGLVNAFRRAFPRGDGARLVIKTINGDKGLADLERLRAAVGPGSDVRVIDEYYTSEARFALLQSCDCYVSLHRSEGYGLTIAEAMALGKPVVATAYSGNMDFMTPENSYLVDYVMSPVPPRCDPYPEGALWADPDVDAAAECLRRVYDGREEAARKGRRAAADIREGHSVERAAAHVAQRLENIRNRRRSRIVIDRSLSVVERQERERLETDRRYNDALTALDQALPRPPAPARGLPTLDLERVSRLNELWDILADGPAVRPRGLRSRLASFVWRLVEPHFARQQAFNSVLVDHVNRTAPAERAWQQFAAESDQSAAVFRAALAHFQSQLIQHLQQITPYVDARDRAIVAQMRGAMDRLADELTGAVWDKSRTRLRRIEEIRQELATIDARISALRSAPDVLRARSGHAAPSGRTPAASGGRPS